jgi:hypothetical protein
VVDGRRDDQAGEAPRWTVRDIRGMRRGLALIGEAYVKVRVLKRAQPA